MLLSLSRSGPLAHALAGLDIALWDIRGKLAGVPVSTLLGGEQATVPVVNGGVEVPQRPGLGADPEDDLIALFRV